MDVECTVSLAQGSRRIDVEIALDNQADDHRVRDLLPTPFAAETVVADNQFGCITRPVDDPEIANWEADGWKEAPIPVWQLMNFAALQNGEAGMAVFTNGLREFEVISSQGNDDKDTLALPLQNMLREYSWGSLDGMQQVLGLSGRITVTTQQGTPLELSQGESCVIPAAAGCYQISGSGEVARARYA